MALKDDIVQDATDIWNERFEVSSGWAIPSTTDITFDNQGKRIKLVALFVDIRKSTTLVNTLGLETSARLYKSYVRAVTQIVKARDGRILSFNGDGIVAGFVGAATAENAAVLSGLNINWFLWNHLKPTVDRALAQASAPPGLTFDYGIGVDVGEVLIVKAGMRGEDNHDLVWAGNPVNYAVKVGSNASLPNTLYVSTAVFGKVHHSLKTYDSSFIWDVFWWAAKNQMLWRTTWNYSPDVITTVPVSPPSKSSLTELLKAVGAPPPIPVGLRRRSLSELNSKPAASNWWETLAPTPRQPNTFATLADLLNPKPQSMGEILADLFAKGKLKK